MECIENILGLKGGCADLSSTQSVFINSHVTYNELAQIVDSNEQATVEDFFRERRALAVAEMVAEIQDHNRPSYKFPTVLMGGIVGEETDELRPSQVPNGMVGVSLKRRDPNTYLQYRVTEVMLFLNYTGTVAVTAYNLDTGQTLATVNVDAVAGQISTVQVEWAFPHRNIAILYDNTGKPAYRTALHGGGCATCSDGWVYCNKAVTGRQTRVNIGDPVTNVTAKVANDMGGLKVRYNVECDHASWLCSIRAHLGLPLTWKTAELVMEYGLFNSSRENRATKLDRTQQTERQAMYREKYEQAMKRLFQTIRTPQDAFCFVCERKSKYVTML